MATNAYFRNHDNVYEQNLIDDLVIESIKIYGIDVKFITRLHQNIDRILNEDDLPTFDKYYDFEVYIKNVDGFEGEGDFLSKFGLQIRDSITFTVAIRTFEQYVTREQDTRLRPLEGEMIWMPLNQKMYKIQHVEHESVFYQTGALQICVVNWLNTLVKHSILAIMKLIITLQTLIHQKIRLHRLHHLKVLIHLQITLRLKIRQMIY
jgi:hypothetical protein